MLVEQRRHRGRSGVRSDALSLGRVRCCAHVARVVHHVDDVADGHLAIVHADLRFGCARRGDDGSAHERVAAACGAENEETEDTEGSIHDVSFAARRCAAGKRHEALAQGISTLHHMQERDCHLRRGLARRYRRYGRVTLPRKVASPCS